MDEPPLEFRTLILRLGGALLRLARAGVPRRGVGQGSLRPERPKRIHGDPPVTYQKYLPTILGEEGEPAITFTCRTS